MSSKKKKMAKLKRVMAQVKKQDRREKRNTDQNFAAIQLLHDPQVTLDGYVHSPGLSTHAVMTSSWEQVSSGQSDESLQT